MLGQLLVICFIVSFFFFSSRRRHTRCREVSWARRCVQETACIQSIKILCKHKCFNNSSTLFQTLTKKEYKILITIVNGYYYFLFKSSSQYKSTSPGPKPPFT
eukprot:TRINITY_DN36679_c0_g1_i2.p2 TRINITY_DN36679_c0_g1~~TRINITY_DN36679_c0_g1_i2.p2  ORF type:complete len:103 (+),score=24.44 TRINITY_DN36679_c0_g1_i2:80-388(+)